MPYDWFTGPTEQILRLPHLECAHRNDRKRGTASLRSRTCAKRNAVFGARFKSLFLHFLNQKGNPIRIKTGLETYLICIQTRTPPVTVPPFMITLCKGPRIFSGSFLGKVPQNASQNLLKTFFAVRSLRLASLFFFFRGIACFVPKQQGEGDQGSFHFLLDLSAPDPTIEVPKGPKGSSAVPNMSLGGRLGYSYFSAWGRGRGSPRRWEGAGGELFIESPRGGGVLPGGWGRGGEQPKRFCGEVGGGANFFFPGPKFPPSINFGHSHLGKQKTNKIILAGHPWCVCVCGCVCVCVRPVCPADISHLSRLMSRLSRGHSVP